MAIEPVTREERFLAAAGGQSVTPPTPITRKEQLLQGIIDAVKSGGATPDVIEGAVNDYLNANPVKPGATTEQAAQIEQNKNDIADLQTDVDELKESGGNGSGQNLDLGFIDGRLYIMVSGVPVGNGVEINGTVAPSEGVVVFTADFSGDSPNPAQFYAWEGRVYAGAEFDALANIQCTDGVAVLTTKYDADNGRWLEQMMTTGGLFESDDFTCKFRAKFSGLPGAWNYFITYGTGTHWTDGVYSDGIKWPSGSEIDAFEQAATYSETPTGIGHTAHWGSGSNSGYPDTHEFLPDSEAGSTSIATDEWHDFKFSLKNGIVTMWIDGAQVHEFDLSEKSVDNNYLVDYHPFLRPHAFYMAAQCHAADSRTDTANVFTMEISDLEVYQDSLVECAGLEIYPQMWSKGTELVFPVGAELYLERNYTPANTSNKACRWESSNPAVATVVQGYVKVVGTGTAVITATCGEATAQYTVTAAGAANIPCAKIAAKGEIGATVGDVIEAAEQLYLYPSFTTDEITLASDSELVSIDGASITMLASGNADINVTVGARTATLSLSIASGAPELMTTHDFIVDGVTNNGPSTCDVTFVADGIYTIHYRIAENPEYDGKAVADMACRMVNASNANRLPMILNKMDDAAEVTMGNASPVYAYAPSAGDWVTLLFTAASGYSGQVYVNGELVKGEIRIFPDYVYIGEALKPTNGFRNANTRVKYCVDRIEVYRGDDHERHKTE